MSTQTSVQKKAHMSFETAENQFETDISHSAWLHIIASYNLIMLGTVYDKVWLSIWEIRLKTQSLSVKVS